jgi:hypothetical protein
MAKYLSKIASKYNLDLINNIIIPSNDGTTQIDHILVGKSGIIVIETKNYSGWIFGSRNLKMWTQTIYHNSYKFQNPLHQNYKHVMSLSDALKTSPQHFHSLVVFLDGCEFKTDMPDNVIHPHQINNWIENFNKVIFTDPEKQIITDEINAIKQNMTILDRIRHTRHVNEIISNKSK